MKTRYALGAVLIGSLAFATTGANASETQVRFNVHLGVPVHGPVVIGPHLYYPPVVYHGYHGYHHGHHYGHHRYQHHGKHHHPGSHWRHNDGHRGRGFASVANPPHRQGGHGWRGR